MAGNFEFAYNLNGANTVPVVQPHPVAGSETLVIGDLVDLTSTEITKAGASTATVFGVMMEISTTQTAGTLVQVARIQRGQVWRATADADATGAVLGAQLYDINVTTQEVDIGDSANGCIFIEKLGDANTDVYVSFSLITGS